MIPANPGPPAKMASKTEREIGRDRDRGSGLTLPYLPGKTFYQLALRPVIGPMRIPELTTRLYNPQV